MKSLAFILISLIVTGCTSSHLRQATVIVDAKDARAVREKCYPVGHVSFTWDAGPLSKGLIALETSSMSEDEIRREALDTYLPELQEQVTVKGGDTLVISNVDTYSAAGQAYVCAGYIDLNKTIGR